MGVRERHRADVVRRHVERRGETATARHQRLVGVLHALRLRGGAGRVVDPAHLRRPTPAAPAASPGRRSAGRVPISRTVGGRVERRRPSVLRHLAEVAVLPDPGDDEEVRPARAQHGADLALPVEMQHRVLNRAEPRQRHREHDALDPGRQLPGDLRAGPDAESDQAGSDALDLGGELREADPPARRCRAAAAGRRTARPGVVPAPRSSAPRAAARHAASASRAVDRRRARAPCASRSRTTGRARPATIARPCRPAGRAASRRRR